MGVGPIPTRTSIITTMPEKEIQLTSQEEIRNMTSALPDTLDPVNDAPMCYDQVVRNGKGTAQPDPAHNY